MYQISYWNHQGKYSNEYGIIFKMFFEKQGKGNFKKTENEEVNKKLKELLLFSNRLYKFYNDGIPFQYQSKKIHFISFFNEDLGDNLILKNIEKEMDKLISEIWAFLILNHPREIILEKLR